MSSPSEPIRIAAFLTYARQAFDITRPHEQARSLAKARALAKDIFGSMSPADAATAAAAEAMGVLTRILREAGHDLSDFDFDFESAVLRNEETQ